jgi:hypothetical protein
MNASDRSAVGVSWLIVKAMAVVYLIAFLSLSTQIIGLVGHDGIVPFAPAIEKLHGYGSRAFWGVPTLCWFNTSDAFLRFLTWAGAAISVLMFLGVAPVVMSVLAWIFYLSLTIVGRDFLGFQWDNLLLEAGFLLIFLAPLSVRPGFWISSQPSKIALWLWRLLLFKLMLQSGLVKLLSGDANWTHLKALTYHYWSQPLPNVISWYADKLPAWFQALCVVIVFLIELIVPFVIFAGRWARIVAFWTFTVFQIIIILTGNYCFFNILAVVIGFSLLDDAYLQRFKLKWTAARAWPMWIAAPVAVLILTVSFSQFALMVTRSLPKPLLTLVGKAAPFRTVNNYGLFAVMTTQRHEIVLEGSRDGETWTPYEFRWKPGDLKRAPGWVMPHQPRLDWQMWFAALGDYQENPWVLYLMAKLLENAKPVVALLKTNPFADAPPRYIRAVVYDYHFTDAATLKRTGNWWRRELIGLYCPVVGLRGNAP